MQELDEGAAWPGPTAVRRRIAWEYPSEARPNDGERGYLRALRGAAAGSLVMVELLVARLGQEIRKTYPLVFVNGTPEAASCTRRPGPRTRRIYVLFSLYQFCLSGKNWQGVAARLRAAHAQRQPPAAAEWYKSTATPSPRRPASGRVPPRWLSLLAAPGPPAAPAAPSEPRAGLTIDNDVVNFRR